MKVFFGGSLPRFKADKNSYLEIRKVILNLGHRLTRDWINEEIKAKTKRSLSEMYELTEKAIKDADAVILEYSHDISAVGQQLVLSLQRSLPTLLLVKVSSKTENSPLSDYFVGLRHYKYLRKERYKKYDLKKVIFRFLKWVEENKSMVRFNLEIEKGLDDYLKERAKKHNSSKAEEIRKLIIGDMKVIKKDFYSK